MDHRKAFRSLGSRTVPQFGRSGCIHNPVARGVISIFSIHPKSYETSQLCRLVTNRQALCSVEN